MKKLMAVALVWLALVVGHSAQAGTVTYVYSDPQGTPLAEADANGNVTATFDYRPYGAQALGSPKSGPGYTGHVNDADSGLVYMQMRYYDPQVGRFLSTDPLRNQPANIGNINAYSYALNNPNLFVDPSGMYSCRGSTDNCKKIDGFIKSLRGSLGKLKKGSDEYNKLARVINYYGDKDSNKNIVIQVIDGVKSGQLGDASEVSMPSIRTQASKFSGYPYNMGMKKDDVLNDTGAAILAHEGRHRLDAQSFDPTASKVNYIRSEVNAERTESAAYQATGLATGLWWPGATSGEIDRNIQVQSAADTAVWCSEATVCH